MNLLSLHNWSSFADKIHKNFDEDPIYYMQTLGITCDAFRQLIEGKIYESDSETGLTRDELDYF